jgi:hypothetical protein
MVLDASGHPVIAYTAIVDDDLRLAHCGDADCATKTINTVADEDQIGIDPSLVLDPSGFPILVYRDVTDDEMELAVCGDAHCDSVTIYQIDTRAGAAVGTAMALQSGFPVVAHYNATDDDLVFVYP